MKRLGRLPLAVVLLLVALPQGSVEGRGGPGAATPEQHRLHYVAKYTCKYPNFVDVVVAKGTIPFTPPPGDGPVQAKGTFHHQGTGYVFDGPLVLKGNVRGGMLYFTFPAGFHGGQRVYNRTDALQIKMENGARVDVPVIGVPGVVCTGTCYFTMEAPARLVSLEVVEGTATKTHVKPPRTWAAVKEPKGHVIVEAHTTPDKPATWARIRWGGDAGDPVPGQANRRRLSKAQSRRYVLTASLGKDRMRVDLWILWAEVEILVKGPAPLNAPKLGEPFVRPPAKGKPYVPPELGAHPYDGGSKAAGRMVAVGQITPPGVHQVVTTGWKFKRDKVGRRYEAGVPHPKWDQRETDDSRPAMLNLVPDDQDRIYDFDAPTIGGEDWFSTLEAYINFFQWVEWDGQRCSEEATWHWRAQWRKDATPPVLLKDVGKGHQPIPQTSLLGK